jgi:hypothetical protein
MLGGSKLMTDTFGPGHDWRGTKIEIGQQVLYPAAVGQAVSMVEGVVQGFTKSGRVNVEIVRRAYGTWQNDKTVVHVGADRITVLNTDTLPPTTLPTAEEEKVNQARLQEERQRHLSSHILRDRTSPDWPKSPCTACSAGWVEIHQQDCTRLI